MCGTAATPGTFWRGLRLLSMDGTLLDVPDSDANAAAYTRSANGSRPAPYPQVRLLALAECGTLSLLGAVFSFAVGERTLARRLLPLLKPGVPVTHISFKNALAAVRRTVGTDFPPSETGSQAR